VIGPASWLAAWRELGATSGGEELHRRLIGAWSEPQRSYHTLQHLRECLEWFDAARDEGQRPAEVAAALWFHDAVYDPRRSDNEERSAEWARSCGLQAGVPEDAAARVHALVMATKGHAAAADTDTQLLLDIDLSILGAASERFAEFEAQIREEYSHVPDDAFRAGRTRILEGFLARPRLYGTRRFHDALELRARDNLQRAVAAGRRA
jgi:predicted metal-dependent HD superfamily phosphohydrolase